MQNNRVVTCWNDGYCEVTLYQGEDGKFMVDYGGSVVAGLDYADAAKEFGECVLHSLTCASKVEG